MAKTNKELLFLYSENARVRIRELANLLKKSPQRLKYNVKTLEKDKTVFNPYSVIDYSFFGLLLFKVYFKGGYVSEKNKNEILQKLREHSYIVSIYELDGAFDLVIEMEAPNASRFNKELRKITNSIPTLNNYKILLNVVTHIYPRIYLLKHSSLVNDLTGKFGKDTVIGGDRRIEEFSKNETAVLHNIVLNPKTRLTRLAQQTGMNIKTANSILKKLSQRKILKGYKNLIDTTSLGIHKNRLFLKLHNLSQERENQLMEHIMKTPEIIQINKTVGDWDMELDLESFDKSRIRFLTVQLREEFGELIETFDIMEFYHYHKKTFLPNYLLEEFKEEDKK
ncbi:Lrp/AsnC family transcriptional regulator [Candidatus Woesearchaeota archaeon]|nr:Lrp/AsnC family transcriptional regulator [Candidatus Woesearchaeota archaeon]